MFGALWKMCMWQRVQTLLRGWDGGCYCSFLESRSPWLCEPVAGSVPGTSAMTQSLSQQDPLEGQGRIFLETFYLGFWARRSHEVSLWAVKAEFTISNLIQSPWKIMERITGSGKSCVRPKQKLDSRGDFPRSRKAPARLYPSEHSPFILRRTQADLLTAQAPILTLFRLMETWRNFFKVSVDATNGKSEWSQTLGFFWTEIRKRDTILHSAGLPDPRLQLSGFPQPAVHLLWNKVL